MSKYKKPYDRTVHRLREIERIVNHRHGVLPDTDDVDIVLNQVACCILQMRRKKLGQPPEFDDLVDRLSLWCARWAPKASILQCRDAAREALWQRRIDCGRLRSAVASLLRGADAATHHHDRLVRRQQATTGQAA